MATSADNRPGSNESSLWCAFGIMDDSNSGTGQWLWMRAFRFKKCRGGGAYMVQVPASLSSLKIRWNLKQAPILFSMPQASYLRKREISYRAYAWEILEYLFFIYCDGENDVGSNLEQQWWARLQESLWKRKCEIHIRFQLLYCIHGRIT